MGNILDSLKRELSESPDEVFLRQGDYVHRLTNYDKSQATKHAWRKYRHNFMQGIRKFSRKNTSNSIVKKALADIKKELAPKKSTDLE